jgi:DNA-binding LacI/PurR family transcriptional regulator
LSGFLEFCVNANLPALWENIPLPVKNAPENFQAVAEIIEKWEKLPDPPDAVVTVNYLYGAVLAALRPGIAVAAGDNKKVKGLERTPRFMLAQDSRAMGAFAAELLLRRIAEPRRKHVRLNCEVVLQGF